MSDVRTTSTNLDEIPTYVKLNYELLKLKTKNLLKQYEQGLGFILDYEQKYPSIKGGKK